MFVAEATMRLHFFLYILLMLSPITLATTDQRFSTGERRILPFLISVNGVITNASS